MTADTAQEPTEELPCLFVCQKCGQCCCGYGGTVVTGTDIERIAAYIGTTPAVFVKNHCQCSGTKTVLAQGQNGYCVFWDGLCRIHPVKPRMCRDWPFIAAVAADPINWQVMAGVCPGMRGDASPEQVRTDVARLIERRRIRQAGTNGRPC